MYGFGFSLSGTQAALDVSAQALSIRLTSDNQIEVTAIDLVTVTVHEPPEYAGSYQVGMALVEANPAELRPVELATTGPIEAGQAIDTTPALWLHDLPEPSVSWALLADGVEVAISSEP